MWTTLILIVLLLLTVGLFFIGKRTKRNAIKKADEYNAQASSPASGYRNRDTVKARPFAEDGFGYLPPWIAAVPLVLALIIGAFACTAIVNAKTEGVLLTFKAPSDRLLDSGLALKAPWQEVVEIDGTRKTDTYNGGSDKDDEDNTVVHEPIKVRLGDGSVAEVYGFVQWHRAEGASNRVYAEYRAEDPVEEMRENLLSPQFKGAINEALGTYRPTAPIDELDVDFTNPESIAKALQNLDLAPDFKGLAELAKANLVESLGEDPLITVEHVTISYISFPESVQDKIDDFLDEVNKTRIALQSQATATAQAEANRILSESLTNNSDGVNTARCFQLIADGKLQLPAGGSCFPGSGGAVVIPSAKQ